MSGTVFQCRTAVRLNIVLRPVDDRQRGKPELGCDGIVRFGHPRARPDQLAVQGEQASAMSRIEPLQQLVAVGVGDVCHTVGQATCAVRPGPQRDQHAVYVDKDQRPCDDRKHAGTVPRSKADFAMLGITALRVVFLVRVEGAAPGTSGVVIGVGGFGGIFGAALAARVSRASAAPART